jgi:hypothetical protein
LKAAVETQRLFAFVFNIALMLDENGPSPIVYAFNP